MNKALLCDLIVILCLYVCVWFNSFQFCLFGHVLCHPPPPPSQCLSPKGSLYQLSTEPKARNDFGVSCELYFFVSSLFLYPICFTLCFFPSLHLSILQSLASVCVCRPSLLLPFPLFSNKTWAKQTPCSKAVKNVTQLGSVISPLAWKVKREK